MRKRKNAHIVQFFRQCTGWLLCIMMIVLSGCPQPVAEVEEKAKHPIGKTEKKQTGKGGKTDTQGSGSENGNNDASSKKIQIPPRKGKRTYEGLDIAKTLSRTSGADAKTAVHFVLDPENAATIYPGSVLHGDSIGNQTYREIINPYKRSARFYFSLKGVTTKKGEPGVVQENFIADSGSYAEFSNKVLSQKIDSVASIKTNYEEFEITGNSDSKRKFELSAGFSLSKLKVKLGIDSTVSSGNYKHVYLVRFTESFYTVNMVKDAQLASEPLITDIEPSLMNNVMPVYVSSVTYGRTSYLLIKSSKEKSEIKKSLDAALKIGTKGPGGEVSDVVKNLEENSEIRIFTIGGGAGTPTKLSEFSKNIAKGGFSDKNPGQIISYRLNFLDTNEPAYRVLEETDEDGSVSSNGGTGSSTHPSTGSSGSSSGGTSGTIPDGKLKITAQIKNITAQLKNSNEQGALFGVIDMYAESDQNKKVSLFNYAKDNAHPINYKGITPMTVPAVTLTVSDKSQILVFKFAVKRTGTFADYLFTTATGIGNTVKCRVDDIVSGKKFRVNQKIGSDKYLEFEAAFKVERAE